MYCGFVQTRQKSGSETDACVNSMPSLYDVARGITLWEFLRLKVRKDSDRPHSAPRLAQMIGEFDALMQQLRSVVQDQLVPVSPKTGIAHHASKILVVSLLPALFSLLIFSRTPCFSGKSGYSVQSGNSNVGSWDLYCQANTYSPCSY